MTLTLLRHIGAFLEMHAIDLHQDPPVQQLARVSVDEGGDTDYRCACLLGERLGLSLPKGEDLRERLIPHLAFVTSAQRRAR